MSENLEAAPLLPLSIWNIRGASSTGVRVIAPNIFEAFSVGVLAVTEDLAKGVSVIQVPANEIFTVDIPVHQRLPARGRASFSLDSPDTLTVSATAKAWVKLFLEQGNVSPRVLGEFAVMSGGRWLDPDTDRSMSAKWTDE